MNKSFALKFAALAGCLAFGTAANAATVVEASNNSSFANAQNLDGNFTTDFVSYIANSTTTPHVTVLSTGFERSYDYYRFTVDVANTVGLFDIDFGSLVPNAFDSVIALFDGSQGFLASNDDSPVDPGSLPALLYPGYTRDSQLSYTFANTGQYYLRVGQYQNPNNRNGSYALNVSLDAPEAVGAVPEPATWALLLLGFFGVGGMMRSNRRKQNLAVTYA